MPIYAYRCASCGHAKDVLQKLSDPPLTVCPSCGAESFAKQVTAAGFQLKGSGWYATDFKSNGAKKPADGGAKTEAGKDDGTKGDTAKSGDAATTTKAGDAGSSSSSGSSAGEAPKAAGCGGGCACH
ncbi:MAG TPA: zinc ribbon domain-containing protein [Burkholderiaceae bacterium]|nr:zinc ribbon domain-containing protein [Burkholderiaceae bacterium]